MQHRNFAAELVLTCPTSTGQVGVAYSSALLATGGVPPYTFSITSGSLPPGLTLNTSTGAITGTPTTYGTFNFTAKVVDSTGTAAGTTTANCSIVISPPQLVLTCPTSTGQVGVAYSSALLATGGVPPYTYSITSGSLPPGLTLNTSTGAITGTPTTYGTFNFTAKVVDSTGTAAGTTTANCSIVISPPTLVLTCPTSTGQVGVAYSSALVASGGVPPYTYSISSGSLPPGLTLNPTTGAITGTPTTYGTFNFTAKVVDSTGTAAGTTTANCSIVISPPTLVLTCPTSTGQVGVAYSSALLASGGVPPYTYSISSGSLPPGLTLNPTTGAITGTPTTYGTFNFTAKVVDSTGAAAGTTTANCSIVISPPQLVLTCPTSTGQVGVAYSSALLATGGVPPYTYSITSGSLPPGLTLNPSTGAITGTPTTYGTFNFTAKVVDSTGAAAGTTTANCSIVISPPTLVLTCPTSTGQVGVAYSSALVASGGVPPYTFSITSGSLPPGLTLNPSTGAITGTPTTYGTFNFTAKVVDSTGTAAGTTTANCSIVISPPQLVLTCPTSTGQVGVAYSSALLATGGVPPYTYSITSGSLPPGLTLNPTTGAITGTPTTYGTFNFTAKVVDSTGAAAGTTTANCSIVISPPTLVLTCPTSTGQVGVAYSSALLASGGVPPYTFSITSGSLPPGLTLNTSTGAITGTPTTYGTFNFTAKVVDSTGTAAGTTTANCSIVISPPTLVLTCPTSTGQVGVAYSSALLASGGVPPYTYSITSGSLPPGLTLNTSTGAITGTPTTYGTFNFTAKVVDSTGTAAGTTTANCSIVISPPTLTLVCASSAAKVGFAYSSSVVATGGTPPYTFSIISGSLPPGLTLNPFTGAITGTPTSEGTFTYTVEVTDATGATATASCTITTTTCGSALTPITYNVHENNTIGEIVWFNSHLTKLMGTVPTSNFQIFITGGQITFGPTTLSVPDGVITFSSTASCAKTTFNTTLNRWETTIPLSSASKADEIFAAGIAYEIPSGFPQNVNNVTWSADISASAPGIVATWQYGASNWLTQNNGSTFPALSESPFTPDYNGMMVMAAHNATTCYGQGGDHAGAPEFSGRQDVLTGGGSGGGGSNWTGSFSSTPPGIQICQPSGPPGLALSCPASTAVVVNGSYSSPFVASGGTSPYTFGIASGTLPPDLALDSSTGAVTGTVVSTGTFSFTGEVTDSSSPPLTATSPGCGITVNSSGQCLPSQLGAASGFSVFGLQGGNLDFSSGGTMVTGNVGVGVNGQLNFSGGGLITGILYADPTAQVQLSGGSQVTGNETVQSMTAIQNAAVAAATALGSLSPTQSYGSIQSSTTFIGGGGGQNVIQINGQVNLGGNSTLTVQGGPNDTFVFNISGNFQLSGGSNIVLNGISPNQVLWLLPTSGAQVQTTGNSNTEGIFLVPNGNIQISGGVHISEFIAGQGITLHSAPVVNAFPPCE